jgi:hypothetical protein
VAVFSRNFHVVIINYALSGTSDHSHYRKVVPTHTMKACSGGGGILRLFLFLLLGKSDQLHVLVTIFHCHSAPSTHLLGGWMGPIADLDAVEKTNKVGKVRIT